MAFDLALALGAEVVASRPVVDSGWLMDLGKLEAQDSM